MPAWIVAALVDNEIDSLSKKPALPAPCGSRTPSTMLPVRLYTRTGSVSSACSGVDVCASGLLLGSAPVSVAELLDSTGTLAVVAAAKASTTDRGSSMPKSTSDPFWLVRLID